MTPSGAPVPLPEAIPLVSVSVAYSWACNFQCAHCGLPPDGQPRSEELTATELREWLSDLPAGLSWVCFTGGEPALDPDRLVAGIAACTSARIPTTVVTNGKWIAHPEHGEDLMERLWDSGLRVFAISYDEYHEPFWSKERVKETISRAVEFGFSIGVKLVRSPLFIDSLEGEFRAIGAQSLVVEDLSPVGRGRLLPVLASSPRSLSHCLELLSPMLTPNGDVYACCASKELGPGSSHYLGNARRQPLREILEARQRDPLLIAETVLGPGGLAELLGEAPYGSLCGLCHEIMSDPRKVEILRERIQEPDVRRRISGRHLLHQMLDDRRDLLLPTVYDAWANDRANRSLEALP